MCQAPSTLPIIETVSFAEELGEEALANEIRPHIDRIIASPIFDSIPLEARQELEGMPSLGLVGFSFIERGDTY